MNAATPVDQGPIVSPAGGAGLGWLPVDLQRTGVLGHCWGLAVGHPSAWGAKAVAQAALVVSAAAIHCAPSMLRWYY